MANTTTEAPVTPPVQKSRGYNYQLGVTQINFPPLNLAQKKEYILILTEIMADLNKEIADEEANAPAPAVVPPQETTPETANDEDSVDTDEVEPDPNPAQASA